MSGRSSSKSSGQTFALLLDGVFGKPAVKLCFAALECVAGMLLA
jgi:hypothetical protein